MWRASKGLCSFVHPILIIAYIPQKMTNKHWKLLTIKILLNQIFLR